jgi:hypothetical protein
MAVVTTACRGVLVALAISMAAQPAGALTDPS